MINHASFCETSEAPAKEFQIKISSKEFSNTESNCWASAVMQLLYCSDLGSLVKQSEEPFSGILFSIFAAMESTNDEPIPTFHLREIANDVGMEMALTDHQEIRRFFQLVIDRIIEDELFDALRTLMKEKYLITVIIFCVLWEDGRNGC